MVIWGLNLTAVKLLTQVIDFTLVALLRMVIATVSIIGVLNRPWAIH